MSALGILASLVAAWAFHDSSIALLGYGLAVATVWSNGVLFNFSAAEIHADLAPQWAVVLGPLTSMASVIAAIAGLIFR